MNRPIRLLFVVLLLAATLRGLLYPVLVRSDNPGPDGYDYLRVARDFLGEPFPYRRALDQTAWAPGWPAAMAVLFACFGDSMTTVRVANAAMWLATLFLAYGIVRRLWNADVALVATTLVAWDNLIHFIKYSNYEVFLSFVMTAALAALLAAIDRIGLPAPAWMALAGLLSAVACLCQGKCVIPMVALGLLAAVIQGRRPWSPTAIAAAAAFLVAFFVGVFPYAMRNYVHEGRFSFVATVGAPNLVIGNGPHANGEWTWTPPALLSCLDGVPEAQKTSVALRWVWTRFVADPGRFVLEIVPRKFYYFWGLDTIRHNAFLILMVLGLWLDLAGAGRRPRFLLWLPVALFLGIHLAFYGFERYRYPILPAIHAYVAIAILALGSALFGRTDPAAPTPELPSTPAPDPTPGLSAGLASPALALAGVALIVPTVVAMVLAHRAMAPPVVYGLACAEEGRIRANYWSTVDQPFAVSCQPSGGPEAPCGPTHRRVHCCYFADVPTPTSPRATFRVKDAGGQVLHSWTQELP